MLILLADVNFFPLTKNFMETILLQTMNFKVTETWGYIPTELLINNWNLTSINLRPSALFDSLNISYNYYSFLLFISLFLQFLIVINFFYLSYMADYYLTHKNIPKFFNSLWRCVLCCIPFFYYHNQLLLFFLFY